MSDTAIMGENVEIIQAMRPRSAFTWSVVIAGALAAAAVSFILITLGSGIGLTIASPYSGPSPTTLGITGAVWLVFTGALAFAVGGYLAARLRLRDPLSEPETRFRDGAHGFMAWALGAAVMALVLIGAGAYSVKSAADVAGMAGGAMATSADSDTAERALGYFVDRMFRRAAAPATTADAGNPAQTTGAGNPGESQSPRMSPEQRAEVVRIVLSGISGGSISEPDRQYLAQLVRTRTGLAADEAIQRVREVQEQAAAKVAETADTARKAAAYLSFWSFMALLFGAVGATLGGLLGGELRDAAAG